MSSEHQQPDQQDKNASPGIGNETPFAGESRRRFTKAGLAASGILMTLASRSALGCVTVSPSAFASANTSRHGPPSRTNALSPGYWKNAVPGGHHKNPNPAWPFSGDTLFKNVFPGAGAYLGANFGAATFLDLLITPNNFDTHSPNQLGRDFVTAYLNAVTGGTPFLPATTVVNMFEELLHQGYYVPTGTIHWSAFQVASYLEGTWQGL
jgi:hypothetical protein